MSLAYTPDQIRLIVKLRQKRRKRQKLTKVETPREPNGLILEYTRYLQRTIVAEINADIEELLIPVSGISDGRVDDKGFFSAVAELYRRIVERSESGSRARDLLTFGMRIAKRAVKTASRLVGIKIGGSDVPDGEVISFVRKNTELITKMSRAHVDRVRDLVLESQIAGDRQEVLRDKIKEATGVADSRAKLIARDQVLTLNADVTKSRHEKLGITHYFWSTSKDSRVRGRKSSDSQNHTKFEGLRFSYADPPADPRDGVKAHPGQRINCRCVAIPDTDGLLARAEGESP